MNKEYYTSASIRYGKVYYRGYSFDEQGNRHRVHAKLDYKPTLYVETKDETSEYECLHGRRLAPKQFTSIPEAREFVKSFEEVMYICGYHPSRFEYNFLIVTFPEKMELGITDINVASVDIETTTEHGKIDTLNTPEEITLITYQNIKTKELLTWGSRPSKVENYVLCKNEQDIFHRFIKHVEMDDPDVLTGWNISGFDIPYIINRGTKIVGNAIQRLSPFGMIEVKDEEIKGSASQKFTIVGRTILDMLELYLKFTFVKRANNRLQTIAMAELGVGKLENPFNSFREFYTGECEVTDKPDESANELVKLSYNRTMMKRELIKRGLIR